MSIQRDRPAGVMPRGAGECGRIKARIINDTLRRSREKNLNPWKKIRLSDYEDHMGLESVQQLQALNQKQGYIMT